MTKKRGRIEGNRCCICEREVSSAFVMTPSPCPHPVHLTCMAASYNNAKEFTCFRCVPLITIMRRISGFESDIELKKELNSRTVKMPKKETFDASDSARLKRLIGADDYEFQLEATKLKCVTLVQSENSDKLLEAEFTRTKLVR